LRHANKRQLAPVVFRLAATQFLMRPKFEGFWAVVALSDPTGSETAIAVRM
jgi:hypothetical protein